MSPNKVNVIKNLLNMSEISKNWFWDPRQITENPIKIFMFTLLHIFLMFYWLCFMSVIFLCAPEFSRVETLALLKLFS